MQSTITSEWVSAVLDVLCVGEVLVDLVSEGEPPDQGWGFQANPGGAPANVAVGLARLGGNAGFLGAFSKDFFGAWLSKILAQEGVDTRFAPLGDRPTTLAFVGLDAEGDRSFSFYRHQTSDVSLTPHDIPDEAFTSTKAVHVCSVSLSQEPAREATRFVARRAKEAGLFLSFDVNLREKLWSDLGEAKHLILEIARVADLIKVSEEELDFLLPGGSLADLRAWVDRESDSALWVLTRGKRSTKYAYGDREGEVGGFPVKATDTTGAGDAFVAALLFQLAAENFSSISESKLCGAITFAHAAAALCVQRHGAIPALPSRDTIQSFLGERP